MVRYIVSIRGFDWDQDYYQAENYEKAFDDLEEARRHKDWLNSFEPDEVFLAKNTKFFHDDELAEALNAWHGGIFTGAAKITKMSYEDVE